MFLHTGLAFQFLIFFCTSTIQINTWTLKIRFSASKTVLVCRSGYVWFNDHQLTAYLKMSINNFIHGRLKIFIMKIVLIKCPHYFTNFMIALLHLFRILMYAFEFDLHLIFPTVNNFTLDIHLFYNREWNVHTIHWIYKIQQFCS